MAKKTTKAKKRSTAKRTARPAGAPVFKNLTNEGPSAPSAPQGHHPYVKPVHDPELPAGAALFEVGPGTFHGEFRQHKFHGARDSVLASLKAAAS